MLNEALVDVEINEVRQGLRPPFYSAAKAFALFVETLNQYAKVADIGLVLQETTDPMLKDREGKSIKLEPGLYPLEYLTHLCHKILFSELDCPIDSIDKSWEFSVELDVGKVKEAMAEPDAVYLDEEQLRECMFSFAESLTPEQRTHCKFKYAE